MKPAFIVSAPSGVGKTTLNRMIVDRQPRFQIAVSFTTRAKRPGEQDGVDYFFVSEDEFDAHIQKGWMLEYAWVHGFRYGTSKKELYRIEEEGDFAILEIDVQGFQMARKKIKSHCSIFIFPPSIQELKERLGMRGTEQEDVKKIRIQNALKEIQGCLEYDYFLINDSLEQTCDQMVKIMTASDRSGLQVGLANDQMLEHRKALLSEGV